jgi:suppressor of ftsI
VVGRDSLPATHGIDTGEIDIMPAARLDVLVYVDREGAIDLLAIGVPTGHGAGFSVQRVLGHIAVYGVAPGPPPLAVTFPRLHDLRSASVNERRTIVFSQNAAATEY